MAASVRNATALSDAAKDLTPVPLDGDWTLLWTDAPGYYRPRVLAPVRADAGPHRPGDFGRGRDRNQRHRVAASSLLTTLRSELSEGLAQLEQTP